MTIIWKRQKKNKQKCKNRIGEDTDKKSTAHTIEHAVQWRTSVALNTHTLKGLGGVDVINRLISEIQVVIKRIFLEVRCWNNYIFSDVIIEDLFINETFFSDRCIFHCATFKSRTQCHESQALTYVHLLTTIFCLVLILRSHLSQPENQSEPIDPAEAAMLLGKTNSTNSRPEKEQAEYAMVKKNDIKEVCIEYLIKVLLQMITQNCCRYR